MDKRFRGILRRIGCKRSGALLAEYCLRDMSRISSETKKLVSFGEITRELVQQHVTKDVEYAVFDLSDAISEKNAAKSIEIIQALLNGGEDAVKIIITLYNFYRRMFYAATGDCGTEIEQTVQRQALRDEACRADGVALHTCCN